MCIRDRSHASHVVENTFSVLVSRFHMFSKQMAVKKWQTCYYRLRPSAHHFPPGTVDVEDENTGEIHPES